MSNKSKVYSYNGKSGRPYYRLKNQYTYYDVDFPLSVVLQLEQNYGTGPDSCSNCIAYGSYKGVQLTLCGNCIERIQTDFVCGCKNSCIEEEMQEKIKNYQTTGFVNGGCGSNCLLNTYYKDIPIDNFGLSDKHQIKRTNYVETHYREWPKIFHKIIKIVKYKEESEKYELKGHSPTNKHVYFTQDGTMIDINGKYNKLYTDIKNLLNVGLIKYEWYN